MNKRIDAHTNKAFYVCLVLSVFLWTSCNVTKSIPKDKYLLRSNTLKIKSDKLITRKGELKDNMDRLIQQKPNYYTGIPFIHIPTKLILYNLNPAKYEKNTENFQLKSKTVERPVLYDSVLMEKSAQNLRNYLINQGYFYSKVRDTVLFKKKKAYAIYNINTGNSYLVNKIDFETGIDDSTIKKLVNDAKNLSVFKKGTEFSFSLFDDERARITSMLRNNGYFNFTQENISFVLDTANKTVFKNADNPIEGAISFIITQKSKKRPTCDIKVVISKEDEPNAFKRYGIRSVDIYPDYVSPQDFRDSSMILKEANGLKIKYHNFYVRENVILKHTYLFPGNYYSEADYDKTINKLSELGIFQYVRISFKVDTANKDVLICRVEMNRNKKYYFGPSIEFSNGSTYVLGSSVGATFRNINLERGANLLTISANGGIEMNDTLQHGFLKNLYVQTKYYGINASIDFPKFIAPFASRNFTNSNLPHTIVAIGSNVLERVDYFTLINNNISFSYNWRESPTKVWTLSPAFVNIIRLPKISDNFQKRLDTNAFLANSYKKTFIEGENISYTFSNQDKKGGRNFSFLKISFEEAGGLLGLINNFSNSIKNIDSDQFAQYIKFDFDAQHQFTFRHSKIALRFDGGIGLPNGQSNTLPYVKQYFVGGPYSLRGWRVRTLGPGSSYDTTGKTFIDRTGDIKLEMNSEFRFDIVQLFAGFIKMNGAIFTDAGNIWLARKSSSYAGGNLDITTFGQDVAADFGAGARFDIATFITLRFDLAFPVKKPYVYTNNGWVIKDIDFSNPTWRANNLVFNIAIGYPF